MQMSEKECGHEAMRTRPSSPVGFFSFAGVLHRHPGTVLYLLMFLCGTYVLWYGMGQHVFAMPQPGTDQRSMLLCAQNLIRGKLPQEQYRYSYAYTLFLGVSALISGGTLWLMRLLQLAAAALIPVMVYRTARLCRTGKTAAFLAGLCCCAYAPLVLISLDFLRAAPLALAFVLLAYFWLAADFRSARGKSAMHLYAAAGLAGALCALGRENFLAVVFLPVLWIWPRDRRAALVYFGMVVFPLVAILMFNAFFYHSFQLVPGNAGNILGFYGGRDHGWPAALGNLFASVPGHLRDLCSSYELHNSLSVYAHREIIPLLNLLCLPFNLLLIFAIAGVALKFFRREVRQCAVLAAAYGASMMFFTVFYRFRIPLVPLLAVLAAVLFRELQGWIKRRRRICPAGFAVIAAGVFAVTWVDPDTLRLESERTSVAEILIFNRRISEAETYLEKMTSLGLDARRGWIFMTKILLEDGDRAGAMRALSRLKALSGPR